MSLEVLSLPYEYIFTLMNFVVSNQEHFQTNSAIYSVNTRNRNHLHRPTSNLSCFQNAYYAGMKIFNSLPSNLRSLMNKQTQFKVALKRYLSTPFTLLRNSLHLEMTHNMCKSLFPYYFVVWTLYNMCILYVILFLCYLYSSLKKYLSVVSSYSVSFLFCSICIYLYVMYLYNLFHILLFPLQT
jgi:hypothetical protein